MSENIEKLTRFQESVFAEIDKEIDEIEADAARRRDEILKKANDDIIMNSYEKMQAGTRDIKGDCARRASKESYLSGREILRHRNELIEQLFREISEELNVFASGTDYIGFLAKRIKSAAEEKPLAGATVYCSQRDEGKLRELLREYPGTELKIDNVIKLGGVSVFYPAEHLYNDRTLDSALAEAKKRFSEKSEMQL